MQMHSHWLLTHQAEVQQLNSRFKNEGNSPEGLCFFPCTPVGLPHACMCFLTSSQIELPRMEDHCQQGTRHTFCESQPGETRSMSPWGPLCMQPLGLQMEYMEVSGPYLRKPSGLAPVIWAWDLCSHLLGFPWGMQGPRA